MDEANGMSRINDLLAQLAAIESTIVFIGPSGPQNITATFAHTPADLSQAQAPFVTNDIIPGDNKVDRVALDQWQIETKVRITFALARKDADLSLDTLETNTLEWRDQILDTFPAVLQLQSLPGSVEIYLTGWAVKDQTIGSTTWVPLQFTLTVYESWEFSRGS